MPEHLNNDARDYDRDFAEFYDDARRARALEFGDQFIGQNTQNVVAPSAEEDTTSGVEKPALGVGRDIGLGVIQSPRSVVRGAAKGVNSTFDFLSALDDWVPTVTFFDEAGNSSGPDFVLKGAADKREKQAFKKSGINADELIPVPEKPKVETVTGNLIEAVSQFAVGLKGVDKISKLANAPKFIQGGKLAQSVLKGAAADVLAFDEHEGRPSNVIEQVPALQNPVTDFLKADPEDGFAEGKLKQAIEGLTLGAVGDVLFDGIRLLKKGKAAKAASDAAGVKPGELFDVPPEDRAGLGVSAQEFNFLGNLEIKEFILKPKARTATRAAKKLTDAEIETGRVKTRDDAGVLRTVQDKPFEINFARIEGPDDIKATMDRMVNDPDVLGSIQAARRGVRDERSTLRAATDIDGFDNLMSRRTGDAFNAEQIVAARKMYYDTTEKLMDAAKRAAAPQASDIDQFNFRKMVAVHHAVQKEFMGVRAEAGRALQAWSIPVGGTSGENVRALEQVLNEFGGADASKTLARKLADMGNNLNTAQINQITQKGAMARSVDAVTEAWTLGLLTNPVTHVVNVSSNVLTGLTLGMERFAQAGFKDTPVTLREGAQYFVGFIESQKMAMKNAATAFRTGQVGHGLSKLDLPRTRNTARDILDPNGKAGILSKGLDYYGGVLSKYAGGGLAAGDEYSKTVLYHAQVRALATREGIAQGLSGPELKEHIAKVLADPPKAMRADAIEFANYGTFTRELGKAGQNFQRVISQMPLLRFVVPFVRTPANIFKFTYERTPLAPLSRAVRDDIAAGGLRRSRALAKIGMGTSVMAMGVDWSMNGIVTGAGPSDPKTRAALRRAGWQPYSIKIGDTYYSYARFEPVATILGLSADLAEILSNYEAYDVQAQEDVDELFTAAALAAGNQVVGKTFLRGASDLAEALADPERNLPGFLRRFAGSFVPAGSAGLDRAINPEMQQVFNYVDAIRERIPGFSEAVPPRRNIWGEPIQYFYPNDKDIAGATAERLMSLFNPVYSSTEKDALVDRWMLQNGFNINMPQKVQRFDGVRVDLREHPKIYDRLVALRGNEIELVKYGGQTMKSFFENLATEEDPFGRHLGFFMAIGNDFDDQQNFISQVVRDYQDAAKEQLLEEFDQLPGLVAQERQRSLMLDDVRGPAREQQKPLP